MFQFSIIMPVYNRREYLHLALCALSKALEYYGGKVEVVITDDGSDDNPLEVAAMFQGKFALQYRWQPHKGFRAGLAFNRGCAIARGRAFLLLDSDILLDPMSLVHLAQIFQANPSMIVAGRYDWMLPMHIRPRDIRNGWRKITAGTLPPLHVDGELKGLIGVDPRYAANPKLFDKERPQKQFATILFAGVLMFPRALYTRLGGFDERMVGHGGQDCELSIRAQLAGYRTIFSGRVHGYHMYHDRNQGANLATCNRNVQYMDRKYDLERVGLYTWRVRDVVGISRIGTAPPA